MPKERINNRYFGQYGEEVSADGHGTRVPLDDSYVKVGWSREAEHVELAVMRQSDDEVSNERWHAQLDRDGLNRLIRTLRKARDQAYGTDA